tara:strand:- start:3076 stop:3393 length:318 start_codon:yes stop_codon:yes gene_type:complete
LLSIFFLTGIKIFFSFFSFFDSEKIYGDANNWTDYQIKTADLSAFHNFFVTSRCKGEFGLSSVKRISTGDVCHVQLSRMVISTWDADLMLAMVWEKKQPEKNATL